MRVILARAGSAMADQAVNTVGNFVLMVFAARAGGADEFGAFAVVYALASLFIAFEQAVIGETFLVINGAQARPREIRSALGAAALVGCLASALALLGVVIAGDETRGLWVALAIACPGLLVHDACRMINIGLGTARRALVSDTLWLVLQLAGFGGLVASGSESPTSAFVVWGLSALVAGLYAAWRLRSRPSMLAGAAWLRTHRRMSATFGWESLAFAGASQLTTVLVSVSAGLAAAGGLRAGQAIYGPANVVFLMLRMAGLAEIRRVLDRPRSLRLGLLALSAVGIAVGVAVLTVVLLIPQGLGEALFGDTWKEAIVVLLPLGLQKVITGLAVAPFAGLRALKATRTTAVLRPLTAVLTMSGGVAGAAVAGPEGCAYGLAIGNGIGVVLLTRGLVLQLRVPVSDRASE